MQNERDDLAALGASRPFPPVPVDRQAEAAQQPLADTALVHVQLVLNASVRKYRQEVERAKQHQELNLPK